MESWFLELVSNWQWEVNMDNMDRLRCLQIIWTALEEYREQVVNYDDERWDEICTVMAWIQEDLQGEM